MKNPFQFNYRLRFNLAAKYKYQWQIWEYKDGEVVSKNNYDPLTHRIVMKGCFLRNKINMATKIFNGGEKNTCAYIECESIEVIKTSTEGTTPPKGDDILDGGLRVSYNPRKTPNWVFEGENSDGKTFDELFTLNREIIKLYEEEKKIKETQKGQVAGGL